MSNQDPPAGEPTPAADGPVKRSDVGYKRPPRKYQWEKGHKHPPRKKKDKLGEVSMSETMGRILNEERRVVVAGKARWVTNAELVVMRAWHEAEKGSATLRREIMRLSLSYEATAPDQGPVVLTDPSAPASETGLRLTPIDEPEN